MNLTNFSLYISLVLCVVAWPSHAIDTSAEEKICSEIGFKPKTEKFGNCVVELFSRKNKGSLSATSASSTTRSSHQTSPSGASHAGDGSQDDRTCQSYGLSPGSSSYSECRIRIDTARKDAESRQSRYQAELAAYEKQVAEANRQRERDRNLRMMELGLGMMAGGGGRGSSDSARNVGPAPLAPSLNQNIFLPDGRMMSCRTNGHVTNCF